MASQLTMSSQATWAINNAEDQTLKHQSDKRTPQQTWWKTPWTAVQDAWSRVRQRPFRRAEPAAAMHTDQAAANAYGLRAATLALGVTTTGRFFYPPLEIAGLPLLVYLGIPPAQTAYTQLWVDGRPSRALAETVALTVCLASGSYWIGSLGCFLYYGGRCLWAQPQPSTTVPQAAEWPPSTTHIRQAGAVCTVATAALQAGDQVILTSGDIVPIDGVITEGSAWLRPQAVSATAGELRKGVGDRITATDIVLVGRICVRVAPATT